MVVAGKMRIGFHFLLPGALCVTAFAQDVQFTLSLKDAKTSYRSGEPVHLLLTFTAIRDGYNLNEVTTQPASPVDTISVSPDTGVAHWLEDYSGDHRYAPDYATMTSISRKPITVELTLNDVFRLDGPGPYSVKVTTKRVSRAAAAPHDEPLTLTSNEVAFGVIPMSDAEEQAEVERLALAIAASHQAGAAPDRPTETAARADERRLSEELSYLAGDAATRQKLSEYLHSPPPCCQQAGLFMARNRALVLASLEAALRDPAREVNPELLHLTARIRVLQLQARQDRTQELSQVEEAYAGELAASLAERTGKSRSAAAMTILSGLPKDPGQAAALSGRLRALLLPEFDRLGPAQFTLLGRYWDLIRDPLLAPSLESMIRRTGASQDAAERGLALRRLIELAPERARPFVVEEIAGPTRGVDYEILATLNQSILPEADAPLLDAIRRQASFDQRFGHLLLPKAMLAARFASAEIRQPLWEIYRASAGWWKLEERASLLGYFARVDEKRALPEIERELAAPPVGQDLYILDHLTRAAYSPVVDALLIKRLNSDDPHTVGMAAHILSQHGLPEDEAPIEARWNRWVDEWRGMESTASNEQQMAQVELMLALLHAKSWKLPDAKVRQLKQECVSDLCRRYWRDP
jgi:hypothetical protein